MSHSSWELLRPTIRKEGSEIWASFNPKNRNDPIYEFLHSDPPNPRIWSAKVLWSDNKYLPKNSHREREDFLQYNPERYSHVWQGEPDDASSERKVLPYELLQTCVDAWGLRPTPRGAFVTAGLDVADTGQDKNALALRSGPELFDLQQWSGGKNWTGTDTAEKAAGLSMNAGVQRFFYDGVGVGAAIPGPIRRMKLPMTIQGIAFGGSPQAKDVVFITGRNPRTNAEYFSNWASQAGWVLRLRAEMTKRLVNGENVKPEDCLFINPKIPKIRDVLAQFAQPEWTDKTGKLKVDKQPRDPGQPEPPSPDCYDAAILAFSSDASRGLRERRMT